MHGKGKVASSFYIAYACLGIGIIRLRSWKTRHHIEFQQIRTLDMEGVVDLQDDDDMSSESDFDSVVFSPSSNDLIFGIKVDGDIVGIEVVRIDEPSGYIEHMKMASAFAGYGLELLLQNFVRSYIRDQKPEYCIKAIRQIVFDWDEKTTNIARLCNMHIATSISYFSTTPDSLITIDDTVAIKDNLISADSVEQIFQMLVGGSENSLMFQYWDAMDLSRKNIRWLCSDLQDTEDDLGRCSPTKDAVRDRQKRHNMCKLGKYTCTMGEVLDRDSTKQLVCTFTLYDCRTPEQKFTTPRAVFEHECLLQFQYWAEVALGCHCKSIFGFVPPSLTLVVPVPCISKIHVYEIDTI